MRKHRETRTARAAILAAVTLLAIACGAGHAHSTAPRSPAAQRSGALHRLAARYLAIAEAGNRRLEIDFDGLNGRDRGNLARAQADLRDAAATERLFDRRVAATAFPPRIETFVHALVWLNESRATLTARAAAAPTLPELHRYDARLAAANGPVEQAVRLIRAALGLPPPDTS